LAPSSGPSESVLFLWFVFLLLFCPDFIVVIHSIIDLIGASSTIPEEELEGQALPSPCTVNK
jgi:hypothetical protein